MAASPAPLTEADVARLTSIVQDMLANSRYALTQWLDAADDGMPAGIWLRVPATGKSAGRGKPECTYYGNAGPRPPSN